MKLETVTITTKEGPVRINRADYDPEIHTLDDGKDSKKAKTPAPPPSAPPTTPAPPPSAPQTTPAPQPVEAFVSKKGKKFVVVDKTGQLIAGTTEYDDEDTAKAALDALNKPAA